MERILKRSLPVGAILLLAACAQNPMVGRVEIPVSGGTSRTSPMTLERAVIDEESLRSANLVQGLLPCKYEPYQDTQYGTLYVCRERSYFTRFQDGRYYLRHGGYVVNVSGNPEARLFYVIDESTVVGGKTLGELETLRKMTASAGVASSSDQTISNAATPIPSTTPMGGGIGPTAIGTGIGMGIVAALAGSTHGKVVLMPPATSERFKSDLLGSLKAVVEP
jgi:hypothetical protein